MFVRMDVIERLRREVRVGVRESQSRNGTRQPSSPRGHTRWNVSRAGPRTRSVSLRSESVIPPRACDHDTFVNCRVFKDGSAEIIRRNMRAEGNLQSESDNSAREVKRDIGRWALGWGGQLVQSAFSIVKDSRLGR